MVDTARILKERDVTAMVALDTIGALTTRVLNLLSHGRRMTMCRRFTYLDNPPEVTAGLTVHGTPRPWSNDNSTGFEVRLQPGLLTSFGFVAYKQTAATEATAWQRYHDAEGMSDAWHKRRRDMTQVHITGGQPDTGPARDDQLVIRAWNGEGVCTETVIAFDYDTGRHNDLAVVRDELRAHLAAIGDQQPWDNRRMFDRVMAALDGHAAPASEEK